MLEPRTLHDLLPEYHVEIALARDLLKVTVENMRVSNQHDDLDAALLVKHFHRAGSCCQVGDTLMELYKFDPLECQLAVCNDGAGVFYRERDIEVLNRLVQYIKAPRL